MYSRFNLPPRRPVLNSEPSMAQQHFKDECDINQIMARYQRTGVLSDVPGSSRPMFGDFSNVSDYQSAQNAIVDVHDSFMSLPSSVRARFNNDPGYLLDFLAKVENRDEAISLGLVNPVSVDLHDGDNGSTT